MLTFYFNAEYFKKLLHYAFPLIFTAIFAWLLNSIDKLSIRYWSDFNELGIYANAFSLVAILAIVQQAFTTFWVPTSYRWYQENIPTSKYIEVSHQLSLFLTILFLIIVMSRKLLMLILAPEYFSSIALMPFLLFFPIMYTLSETTGMGIYFVKKTVLTTLIVLFSGLLNWAGNYFLVPVYGALGAAISTGISFILFFWLRTFISQYYWRNMRPGIHFINITLMMISSTGSLLLENDLVLNLFLILLVIIFNKNSIQKIWNFIQIEYKKRKFSD